MTACSGGFSSLMSITAATVKESTPQHSTCKGRVMSLCMALPALGGLQSLGELAEDGEKE